jgi:hypothetical protein
VKVTVVKQVFGFSVILVEFQDLNVSSIAPPLDQCVMVTLITVCLYLLLIGEPVSLQL